MRKSFRGNKPKSEGPKEFKINEKIQSPELVIIDEDNNNLGILTRQKALMLASEREIDLVEVSPKAVPPIGKLMDYGSFKYQKEKQEKKQKAKQKAVETKTIKLSLRIGEHDLGVRSNQAMKFLQEGDRVKLEMQLRGRENRHTELAEENIKKLAEKIKSLLKDQDLNLKSEDKVSKQGNRLSLNISL